MDRLARLAPRLCSTALLASLCGCGGGATDCHPRPMASPPPYLVAHPPLDTVQVLDLTNETDARRLLARSLQGAVNRTRVRLYLVDSIGWGNVPSPFGPAAHRHWLSVYADQKLITMGNEGSLDDALKQFSSELEGYFLVSEQEPWSINAATTAAATRAAVIATSDDVAALESLGLKQIDSFVGRWPDGPSCYEELANQVGKLPHPGFAILSNPQSRLHDFLMQQGVLTLGGYQSMPEWAAIKKALSLESQGVPIYGYPARDGSEELNAINDISAAGDLLVASDSTPNLSFHDAVRPATPTKPAIAQASIDCNQAELNVVIALSDGDNLIVPLMLYPTSSYWLAPERGRIAINWSISPALATAIAPAAFDYFARTLAPGDELVAMIGPGYAYGGKMPNAGWFYDVAFQQLAALGLRCLWLFDPVNSGSGKYGWQTPAESAESCGAISGLLDGYYPSFFGFAPSEETVAGVPLLRAVNQYADGPAQIATRIRGMLSQPKSMRPPVAFFSAAAWNNDIPTLVQELAPLEQEGVRFLGASTAMACVTH